MNSVSKLQICLQTKILHESCICLRFDGEGNENDFLQKGAGKSILSMNT